MNGEIMEDAELKLCVIQSSALYKLGNVTDPASWGDMHSDIGNMIPITRGAVSFQNGISNYPASARDRYTTGTSR